LGEVHARGGGGVGGRGAAIVADRRLLAKGRTLDERPGLRNKPFLKSCLAVVAESCLGSKLKWVWAVERTSGVKERG